MKWHMWRELAKGIEHNIIRKKVSIIILRSTGCILYVPKPTAKTAERNMLKNKNILGTNISTWKLYRKVLLIIIVSLLTPWEPTSKR